MWSSKPVLGQEKGEDAITKWTKLGPWLYVINASVYLVTELVAALGTQRPLSYVYTQQFISSLGVYNGHQVVEGVPANFSPWAISMNLGFILTGLGFVTSYYLVFYRSFKDNNPLVSRLTMTVVLLFGVGSLLVGIFQGGVPGQATWHGLGARLSFFMGNLNLLLSAIFFGDRLPRAYRLLTFLLAVVGFASAAVLQEVLQTNQTSTMVIAERLTVYPVTL